ncbi:hypothetical protein M2271_003561 [Streptomyces sp. LBL]|uniref:hypothetical protein n=1 Tax=Streptomyces sp. LBL TaxID=2940562 RepID=UPI002474E2DE|nr:hypothetical protein [Streptomyces sp. LBL]MDH6625750.1 hypothetical protein [Streptomyces sp. LBL]
MSAWAELVNERDGDEWLELCSRALEEVQRETSRRNAAKQRHTAADMTRRGLVPSVRYIVGLIDPVVTS